MTTGRYIARGRGRAAACTCGGARGITLVELLVVLTILGLMAAVAIPTFARFGFFSRNETQQGARELYKLLSATRVFAATYRVNTALAYGIVLKRDSLTGQALEAIDAVAMVYRIPETIRQYCSIYTDPDGNALSSPIDIGGDNWADSYVAVTGEQERGFFRPLPDGAALIADNLLLQLGADDRPRDAGPNLGLFPIRIYNVSPHHYDSAKGKWYYAAETIPPLRLREDDQDVLGVLPDSLQFLAAFPTGAKYLEYESASSADPPSVGNVTDFRFPAHVFTPSGRMWTDAAKERFTISVGYPPDADPVERYVDPANPTELRTIDVRLYRGTGRVQIVREES